MLGNKTDSPSDIYTVLGTLQHAAADGSTKLLRSHVVAVT